MPTTRRAWASLQISSAPGHVSHRTFPSTFQVRLVSDRRGRHSHRLAPNLQPIATSMPVAHGGLPGELGSIWRQVCCELDLNGVLGGRHMDIGPIAEKNGRCVQHRFGQNVGRRMACSQHVTMFDKCLPTFSKSSSDSAEVLPISAILGRTCASMF